MGEDDYTKGSRNAMVTTPFDTIISNNASALAQNVDLGHSSTTIAMGYSFINQRILRKKCLQSHHCHLASADEMRYWWVNQNQTFEQEFNGGYLWSPKRKANQHRNAFYDFMRDVSAGDVIFSFRDTFITAIGVARGPCFEAPKPEEFGPAGQNWSHIGWKSTYSISI